MKIKGHHVRIITDDFVYIEENPAATQTIYHCIDEIIKHLHLNLGPMKNRKIFYKDSYGSTDEIIAKSGKFSHFNRNVDDIVLSKIKALLKRG